VQQTFLAAQRALANGSVPREPAAWLATIARNECLARVRERMREPLPFEAEPTEFGADTHSAAVSRYEVASLREALADLPRAQREAILLRELRGLSYDEVARALSVTTAAVESLIFRARRTLQVRLSEALSALSPVALLARLFRGGAEAAGPAVAKVAAIGVGATILAGGAAVGPSGLGLGHSATKAPAVHVGPESSDSSGSPAHVWLRSSSEAADTKQAERESTVTESGSSTDVVERSTPETETESSAPSTESSTPAAEPSTDSSTPAADSAAEPAGSADPAEPADPPEPPEPVEPPDPLELGN
jgi:RNA polymerase sigma-70 factor (ECF subfamily)